MITRLLVAACALGAAPLLLVPAHRPVAPLEVAANGIDVEQAIFFAVLEGLYRDGIDNEVVDVIAAIEPESNWPVNFIYACPVCMPSLNAFRTYRARPEFYGKKVGPMDTFGEGLPGPVRAQLMSEDMGVRHAAIQALVERWLREWLEARRPTEQERTRWTQDMQERRKKGMSILQDYRRQGIGKQYSQMKACPFCDAAAESGAQG